MKTFVFACVHNAGRSQMAAAFFNQMADPNFAHAVSAGTAPAVRVHPEVVNAMAEVGVDLAAAKPQKLTEDLARGATMLITMGCGDQCPYVPGLERADWPVEDPKGKPQEKVRAIRDEIRGRVEALVEQKGLRPAHGSSGSTMDAGRAFKIVTADEWSRWQRTDSFAGSAVDLRDGFIHLSSADQVQGTLERHFQGQPGLVLVEVDLSGLGAAVRWEPSRGGQLFPHVYGTIPLSAVVGFQPANQALSPSGQ